MANLVGNRTMQRGLTLLELLTFLAVTSILAVVSLPIYFDHATRELVLDEFEKMGEFKDRVTESYYGNGRLPDSNNEAGMSNPGDYASDSIRRINVSAGGVITLAYNSDVLGDDNLLEFLPTLTNTGIEWICQPAATNGIRERYVPAKCRTLP